MSRNAERKLRYGHGPSTNQAMEKKTLSTFGYAVMIVMF